MLGHLQKKSGSALIIRLTANRMLESRTRLIIKRPHRLRDIALEYPSDKPKPMATRPHSKHYPSFVDKHVSEMD